MALMDGLSEDELLEDDAPTTHEAHEAQASSTANQLDNNESGGGGGGGGNGGGPAGAPRNGVTSCGSDVGWMVEDGVPSGRSSNNNSIVTENKLFIGIPKEGATISPRHVAAAQEENEDEFGDDDPLFTCDKKTIMGLLAFCALIAVVFLIGQSKPVKALFFNFLETVENASWGAPLMILCLLVMVPAMIPTTPFNVAAGYLFGWAGLPVLMVGAIGGAQIAFLLCRVCLASWARKKLANLKLFKLIDNLSADDDSKLSWRSFKIVLLTRGSPIFPFPLINYAHGVTRVSAMSYFLGTGVGMLPWLTLDVYFGGLLKSLEDVENGHSKGYLITVGISSVITTIYITFKAKEMLKNMRKPQFSARARWTAEDGLEEVLLGEDSISLIGNEDEYDDEDY